MKQRVRTCVLLMALAIAAIGPFLPAGARAQEFIVDPPQIASVSDANAPVVRPSRPAPGSVAQPSDVQRLTVQLAGAQAPGCGAASSQPAPVVALAFALKCDPDLIFEYVYNNIEFEPLYGSNKGALGTLLDRRGNDADQVVLLVALWNAAGYSQTGYANIIYVISGTDIANWLGVKNDGAAIQKLLNTGGIPSGNAVINADGTLASIQIAHFIAALQLNGTWYYFDPSFKQHTIVNGAANLAGAIGYNRSQFLADVGGTTSSVSISSLNRFNLRAGLANYSQNLVNYINQNDRTWSVGNIIGGKTIEPLVGSPIRQQYPSVTPSSAFPVLCPNQVPANIECRTALTITMPGASSAQAIKLYTDQIYGHRVTVFSVPSGSNYVPTLLIDGAPPSCVGSGGCTNVGPATTAGQAWSVLAQVVQTNQAANAACGAGITACKTLTIASGGSYLISTGVGRVGRGMPEYHRQLLAQARAAGNADSSELVLGENLAVIGYAWLAQFSAEQSITDQLAQTTTVYKIALGISGQSAIQQSGFQGPFVDLPVNVLGIVPQSSTGSTTTVGSFTYPSAFVAAALAHSITSSSFESAVLEQTQAPIAGATAASTIKIVESNMSPSYAGALQRTFFADGTTGTGQSIYTSTIRPAIQPHYNSTTDLPAIDYAVNNGSLVLIPENGALAVGHWTGAGYTEILPQSNSISVAQKISGGMLGGFFGVNDPNPAENSQITLTPPASTPTLLPLINPAPSPSNPQLFEPIDAITGAYIYKHDDLVTGGGDFPYALQFSRTYLSSTGSHLTTTTADAVGMGNGWAHAYSANVRVDSDPYIAMGPSDTPAVNAVTSIVALYVMNDLLSVTPTAQTMTVSSMVARWFTDQLTGNVAIVSQPDTTEEFVGLPHADDSVMIAYTAPPGSSARLTQTGVGQFTYVAKDGVTLTFGPTPAGALRSWTYPNGMSVTLTYSGSQLTRVANNLGRNLTLSYAGNNIASVTDDTGRSVTYSYDENRNLIGFTDPLGATTIYSYDVSGTHDTLGRLTRIFYPFRPENAYVTNWYDPLGRVVQQANANGYTSQFHFAGSRSELVDAVGNRHVTYQTARGKVVSDAWVLSSSFGNVFNDTAQQNGVINVTTNQYDGLDRLSRTTLPEGGTTSYSYAVDVNPWANNIASITRTAKPGSPLSPLITRFSYDPIYNKPTSITDPRGLVTAMSYEPATGNLLATVTDAGPPPHVNAGSYLTYNAHGRVLTSTDAAGTVTAFTYDPFENLVLQVADSGPGGLDATTRYAYDALGNRLSRTDPNGNTTVMRYDAGRRLVSVTSPAPFSGGASLAQTTYAYDPDGHVLTVTRSNGASPVTTSTSYSHSGQAQSRADANGNVTVFTYDGNDRLASVTDPLLRVTRYGYDAMGRRISVTNPAIQAMPLEQRSYSPDGLLASLTDANGHATSFAYDGFDRLATTTYPGGSTEAFTYDADDNVLTRKTRAGATIAFAYDTLNRLVTKTPPAPAPVVSYSYDAASRLIGVSDTSGAMTAPSGSPLSLATSTTYDQLNRPLAVSFGPAPTQATPTAGSATFTHGYDATNRRVSQGTSDNSWWFYPAAASAVSYTANALNQYSAVGAVTPTYDGDGNLTSDGTFAYGYDAENRLTSASGAGNAANYTYDGRGRRKLKTVNGATTVFVTDFDNREVLEYDGAGGQVLRWYAYGLGPNDVLNQMNVAAGTRATFIPDLQGSIIGTLDSGTGTLSKRGYLPYGASATATGTFAYTGQRIDPETSGLYYYRARMYAPVLGRFMQVDPTGYTAGNNLYVYVGNDPLNSVDPTGLQNLLLGFGGSAIAPTGGEGSVGYAINPSRAQFGVFGMIGAGIGLNISADIFVGYVPGSIEQVQGITRNYNLVLGPISVTIFTEPASGTIVGGTIGLGPSVTVLGSSVTISQTGVKPLLK